MPMSLKLTFLPLMCLAVWTATERKHLNLAENSDEQFRVSLNKIMRPRHGHREPDFNNTSNEKENRNTSNENVNKPTVFENALQSKNPSPTPAPTPSPTPYSCPNGMIQRTQNIRYWACGSSCTPKYYTDASCNCACINPTKYPTPFPSQYPSKYPTKIPTGFPTPSPSPYPTKYPTPTPTGFPTPSPSPYPTEYPTEYPTPSPTKFPTPVPSASPGTSTPTAFPTSNTTAEPTGFPSPPPYILPDHAYNRAGDICGSVGTIMKKVYSGSKNYQIEGCLRMCEKSESCVGFNSGFNYTIPVCQLLEYAIEMIWEFYDPSAPKILPELPPGVTFTGGPGTGEAPVPPERAYGCYAKTIPTSSPTAQPTTSTPTTGPTSYPTGSPSINYWV
ncbi:hypothetical protein AAMO2058_001753500 [Amorphochlora amoebiformis]